MFLLHLVAFFITFTKPKKCVQNYALSLRVEKIDEKRKKGKISVIKPQLNLQFE